MGTVPTIATFSPGVLTAAYLNSIKAATDFVQSPPSCMAYHSAAISLTSSTSTVLPLGAEQFDNVQSGDPGCHDNVTNNTRIVARTAGKYEVAAQEGIVTNGTGLRALDLRLNAAGNPAGGTSITAPQVAALAGGTTIVIIPVVVIQMAIGDYIEIFAFQNSGGALNTVAGASQTFLRFKWVGI